MLVIRLADRILTADYPQGGTAPNIYLMASWFRAAEELFEVVDRRAKQVTDDLVGGQNPSADLGVFGRVLVANPLVKGQTSSAKALNVLNSPPRENVDKLTTTREFVDPSESDGVLDESAVVNAEKDVFPSSQKIASGEDSVESATTVDLSAENQSHHDVEAHAVSTEKSGINTDANKSAYEIENMEFKPVECKFTAENEFVSVELVTRLSHQENSGEIESLDKSDSSEMSGNEVLNSQIQNLNGGKIQAETHILEEQLDEAQRLLKVASSSGQSKEARLARVCAGLSSRLQEYKHENAQLEELLQHKKEENSNQQLKIKELQLQLASVRSDVSLVESQMSSALVSKNSEIESLTSSLDSLKKQLAISERNVATLQTEIEVITSSRDMTENGMIQTLKEALNAAENRADEAHLSHVATRKAAAQREAELEQCVADVTASLSKMQRMVDERTQRATELENKLSSLEVDCATLTQELHEVEAKLRREQKRSSDEAAQNLQVQAFQEDADRARLDQKAAEGKILVLEAENQKLRVELAGLKRDTDQISTQAHAELEKRFRDLTEVLYMKQTQLEEMASEKAAAIFQLEKELNRSREAQAEAERYRRAHHLMNGWDEENDMKTLDSLGLQQRKLVSNSIQRAAKFLDSGAVSAGKFLWRRPLARLGVFFYLVFVHAFLLYLLHRLQEQVEDSFTYKEKIEALMHQHI